MWTGKQQVDERASEQAKIMTVKWLLSSVHGIPELLFYGKLNPKMWSNCFRKCIYALCVPASLPVYFTVVAPLLLLLLLVTMMMCSSIFIFSLESVARGRMKQTSQTAWAMSVCSKRWTGTAMTMTIMIWWINGKSGRRHHIHCALVLQLKAMLPHYSMATQTPACSEFL